MGLISAGREEVSALILSLTEKRWQKVAMVIAKVIRAIGNDSESTASEVAAELEALVRAGKLEKQGDLTLWRHSEVRLPSTEAPSD